MLVKGDTEVVFLLTFADKHGGAQDEIPVYHVLFDQLLTFHVFTLGENSKARGSTFCVTPVSHLRPIPSASLTATEGALSSITLLRGNEVFLLTLCLKLSRRFN